MASPSVGLPLSAPAPLTTDLVVEGFDCGEPALDRWLAKRALKNESRFSRTYVICQGDRVAAYYSLSAGAVARAAAPGRLRRNAPDTIPVSIIGRLAVDRAYAGRGLGSDLLADALRRVALAAQTIGISAVLIQAKSDAARSFYLQHAEFLEFPEDSRTLFLPIDTLMAAIS
ncbi:GNAT family N-acetyltransferase [Pyruvatibacter mobilis]|uniref:GNAT family N-acetyltransferase n=1 Tax=Pyruvatibacter mobilis TaxID=1712261 RepID=UPI003BAA5AE5